MTQSATKTDDLENDIRNTRKNIDDKLDRIQRKLSPGDMVDSAVDFARTNGGAIAGSVGRTVRDNPIPVALVGVGLVWLALSSRSRRHSDDADGYGALSSQGLRDKAVKAGHDVQSTAGQVRDGIGQKASEVRDQAGELGRKARRQALRAKDASGAFVNDHPLLVGAAGIALGVAVAASLPRSTREDRAFGESSDRVKQAAKETALEEGRKVEKAAKAAIEKAKEEAAKQGLTPSGIKQDAEIKAKSAGASGAAANG